jgi:hypothetical protein
MPIIAGGAAVAGGAIGNLASADSRRSARDAQSEARGMINDLLKQIPDVDKPLLLQQYVQQGVISPEEAQVHLMQTSSLAGARADQGAICAQKQALDQLRQVSQGGLRPEDRLALFDAQRQMAQQQKAGIQGAMQAQQMRGQGGGGAELAAALAAQQSAADTGSRAGLDIAAQSTAAKMAALQQYGNLAGNIRGSSMQEEATRRSAEDAIRQFDTGNQNQFGLYNVGQRNQAQATNLAAKQGIANQNVSQANDELRRQLEAKKWMFGQKAGLTESAAGMKQAQAAADQAEGQRIAGMWSGIGQGVGTGAAGMSGGSSPFSGLFGGGSSMGNQAGQPYNAYNAKPIV